MSRARRNTATTKRVADTTVAASTRTTRAASKFAQPVGEPVTRSKRVGKAVTKKDKLIPGPLVDTIVEDRRSAPVQAPERIGVLTVSKVRPKLIEMPAECVLCTGFQQMLDLGLQLRIRRARSGEYCPYNGPLVFGRLKLFPDFYALPQEPCCQPGFALSMWNVYGNMKNISGADVTHEIASGYFREMCITVHVVIPNQLDIGGYRNPPLIYAEQPVRKGHLVFGALNHRSTPDEFTWPHVVRNERFLVKYEQLAFVPSRLRKPCTVFLSEYDSVLRCDALKDCFPLLDESKHIVYYDLFQGPYGIHNLKRKHEDDGSSNKLVCNADDASVQ